MKKLLQINATANWGSAGKIAECIGQEAMKLGWQSYIAYGRNSNPSELQTIKIGNCPTSVLHFFSHRLLDREGLGSCFATKTLIKKIAAISPDYILLHLIHDHYLNYNLLFDYLNRTDIPVFWTFHDCWGITGHCNHFVEVNCTKWQTQCSDCPQRRIYCDRSKENYSLKKNLFLSNRNLTIISCSNWMSNLVKESFLKDKHIITIHNGINLDIFKPLGPKQTKNDKFRILAVSNVWLPYKGIYDLYKLRKILTEDYSITVVGLSRKQVETLPSGIIGIQRTQNMNELVELYNDADVFINPTYVDNFPTVNIEALACGTPVITYNTGGSPEAIDENTGIVVERGNIGAFASAIQQMRKNPLSSDDCRKRAEAKFDSKKTYAQYLDLFLSK